MLKRSLSKRLTAAAAASLAAIALGAPSAGQEAPGEGAHPDDPPRTEVSVEDAASTTVRVEHKRIPVPSLSRRADWPFTIEVPLSWEVRRDLPATGVFLGPPGGHPSSHPEMLLVRESDVSLDDPEAILANLNANAETADWSLRAAEVRDFGGVRGLWIVREMPPAGFDGERVSYAVKLPLGDRSMDVVATVPAETHDAVSPRVESMLRSLRPTGTEGEPATPKPED